MSRPSAEQIRQFVLANIDNPAAIAAAMRNYGLGVGDIQQAGGWSTEQMNDYMRQAQGVQFPGAGRGGTTPGNLDPQLLARILALQQGEGSTNNGSTQWGGVIDGQGWGVNVRPDVVGRTGGGGESSTEIYGDPRTYIYGDGTHETWGQDTSNVWDDQGTYLGPSSGDSEALSAAKFIASAVGGYYGMGALNGMEGAALAGTDAAMADLATSGGLTAGDMGAGALSTVGGSGMTVPESMAMLEANGMTAAEAAEIVGGNALGTTGTGAGSVAELSGGLNTPTTDPTNYGNEGRNYPTTESTQGPGGSPVNSTTTPEGFQLPQGIQNWWDKLKTGDIRAIQQGIGALGLIHRLTGGDGSRSGVPGGGAGEVGGAGGNKFGAFNGWTAAQQPMVDRFASRGAARTPWTPAPKYAEGGGVGGALGAAAGALGLVDGEGGGQGDQVNAQLSPGEYVFDADVVSALGDGSNAAGARILDEMRERIRAHKRSAPASRIPPPAKAPEQYLREKM